MTKYLTIMISLFSFLKAEAKYESIVTDKFLTSVALIESNGNPNAVGDKGKSLGMFQMSKEAFQDAYSYCRMVNNYDVHWLLLEYGKTDYKSAMKDPTLQKLFAKAYLQFIEHSLIKKKIKPTELKIYMCYNMGVYGAMTYMFNHNDINLSTQKKAIFLRASKYLNQ